MKRDMKTDIGRRYQFFLVFELYPIRYNYNFGELRGPDFNDNDKMLI